MYAEAETIKLRNIDNPDMVDCQLNEFRQAGYPDHNELHCNALVFSDNHDATVIRFREMVVDFIGRLSKRDQLAADFAAWTCGLNIVDWNQGYSPRGGASRLDNTSRIAYTLTFPHKQGNNYMVLRDALHESTYLNIVSFLQREKERTSIDRSATGKIFANVSPKLRLLRMLLRQAGQLTKLLLK